MLREDFASVVLNGASQCNESEFNECAVNLFNQILFLRYCLIEFPSWVWTIGFLQ